MLWLSILTTLTLAAPGVPDIRRLSDERAVLSTITDGTVAAAPLLMDLQDPDLLPARRREIIEALSRTQAPPTRALCALLLTPAEGPLALRQRIDAATILAVQRPPAALGPLLTAFARSRVDDLREDPDVFERALRAAIATGREHPDALRAALHDDLAPVLLDLARTRLHRQWLEPLYGDDTPPLPAPDPDLQERLGAALLDAYDRHGLALVEAMQTERGSLLIVALQSAEDALLTAPDADPRLERVRALRPPATTPLRLEPPPLPGSAPGIAPLDPPLEPPTAAWSFSFRRPSKTLPLLVSGLGLLIAAGTLGARRPRLRPLAGAWLALGLLLTIEGGLRLAGVSSLAETRPLFAFTDWQVEVTVPQGHRTVTPGGWIRYQDIAAEPADFRVVTLGASSAHGSNHLREETFSALLEQGLRRRWPTRSIEVLNFGIGGTISDGVRIAGQEALARGADLLLIYYGHNEVTQFTQLTQYARVRPGVLAARRRLRQSALYSTLARLLAPAAAAAAAAAAPDGEVPPATAADLDRLKALAVENYRYNLDQLLCAADRQGVPVLLMSPATNYPFAELSSLSDDPPDAAVLAEIDRLRGAGAGEAAQAAAWRAAAAVPPGSPTHLEVLRRQAELLAEAGNPVGARAVMQAALDASARPSVITSSIREALRSLSSAHGAPLLDVDRLFHARSPDGLHAPGLFWDDLHPTREGHRLIAEALMPVVSTIAEAHLAP